MGSRIISRYLDVDGDGGGAKNAVGDYSLAAEEFFIAPPVESSFVITRMIVSVVDTASMDADNYGNNIAITNGILVDVQNTAGQIYSLTDGLITTNGGWAWLCFDADVKSWGSGNEHLVVRWTFEKSGRPVVLDGDKGEKLVVTLEDDFTGLLGHRFLVQGYEGGDL